MKNKDTKTTNGGITFLGLLQVAFIVLRLCNVIEWNWIWVLAPIWIPLAIAVAIILGIFIHSFFKTMKRLRGKKSER